MLVVKRNDKSQGVHKNSQSVFSKLLGIESDILVADLLYKHRAEKNKDIN